MTLLFYILTAYAAGAATTVLVLKRQKNKPVLDEISETTVPVNQMQRFTRKIGDVFSLNRQKQQKIKETAARTAIVKTQVQRFTEKIGGNTDAAITKFSELLLSINTSIKNTSSVVTRIRSKMSSFVNQHGGESETDTNLAMVQERYETMLQEIMTQLNLTIHRKKEDITKLDHIRSSTDKIKPFFEEISSIALTTKMISLNAAIEAARAGENGRTFGVVADEIKRLADRSTHSAKEMEGNLDQIITFIDVAITELKDAIDVESRFINSTVILLQDVVMSVVESFVSISNAIDKTLGESSTFRDEVNSIVFNLQFEDICNQMSQHTVHMLDTIQDDLNRLVSGLDDPETATPSPDSHESASIHEQILQTSKGLFTMEEEREIAKAALEGIHKNSQKTDSAATNDHAPITATEPPADIQNADSSDDDDDVFFFDEPSDEQAEGNPGTTEAPADVRNSDSSEQVIDSSDDGDDVVFFDEGPDDQAEEKPVTTPVEEEHPLDKKQEKEMEEDNVTFF